MYTSGICNMVHVSCTSLPIQVYMHVYVFDLQCTCHVCTFRTVHVFDIPSTSQCAIHDNHYLSMIPPTFFCKSQVSPPSMIYVIPNSDDFCSLVYSPSLSLPPPLYSLTLMILYSWFFPLFSPLPTPISLQMYPPFPSTSLPPLSPSLHLFPSFSLSLLPSPPSLSLSLLQFSMMISVSPPLHVLTCVFFADAAELSITTGFFLSALQASASSAPSLYTFTSPP